jgi:hypothetical protein
MLGLDQLAAVRRSGFRPEGVSILLTEKPSLLDANFLRWLNETGQLASLAARPGESFDRLDLRPFVGLRVVVDAQAGVRELTIRYCPPWKYGFALAAALTLAAAFLMYSMRWFRRY